MIGGKGWGSEGGVGALRLRLTPGNVASHHFVQISGNDARPFGGFEQIFGGGKDGFGLTPLSLDIG